MYLLSPVLQRGCQEEHAFQLFLPHATPRLVTFATFLTENVFKLMDSLNIPVPLEADLTCLHTKLLADKVDLTLRVDRK